MVSCMWALLVFMFSAQASVEQPQSSAKTCGAGSEKYWALDKPNNECAESCLRTKVQKAEFWVLTGGQGAATTMAAPCVDHGFHKFSRTDTIGAGPLKIALDKYLPDAGMQETPSPKSKCGAGSEKYWALDKPNNECAESCLSTKVQKAEFWVLTGGQGAPTTMAAPCVDHGFHKFSRTDTIGAGPLKIALDKYLTDAGMQETPSPKSKCEAGSEKYWAVDKPNKECAESCLSTKVQKAEFWVLTGGQGAATTMAAPCADNGFHKFSRTDTIGAGPLKIALDKYLPDAGMQGTPSPKSICALKCSADAIDVYWACAAVCIKKEAPDSCITAGCLLATGAFDVGCLQACPSTEENVKSPVVV